MFYGHHAKPVCLAWAPDNEHFATGGMDMMVYVWDVSDTEKRLKMPGSSLYLFNVVIICVCVRRLTPFVAQECFISVPHA